MPERSQDLLDLVKAADLIGVEYHELSARRVERAKSDEESDEPDAGKDDETPDEGVKPDYALTVDITRNRRKFRLRLRIDLKADDAEIAAVAAAEYLVGAFPAEKVQTPLLIQYANEVGVMTLLPYLRQAIADLTLRVLGTPILMPVLQRGAVAFSDDPDQEPNSPAD